MKYLLDTNICIAIIRRQHPALLTRLLNLSPGDAALSPITVAELFFGAHKSNRPEQNLLALEQFLLPFELPPFEAEAATFYGELRAELEKKGNTIGALDLFIAAHALQLGLILVTNNTKEFHKVPGIHLQDWLSE